MSIGLLVADEGIPIYLEWTTTTMHLAEFKPIDIEMKKKKESLLVDEGSILYIWLQKWADTQGLEVLYKQNILVIGKIS